MSDSPSSSIGAGTVVIITGASKGLGRAGALEIRRRYPTGIHLALTYNTAKSEAEGLLEELELVARDVCGSPPNSALGVQRIYQLDVSNADQCRSFVQDVVAHFGRIDSLVNNAGILKECSLKTMSFEDFQQQANETLQVNTTSAGNLTFLVQEVMRVQKQQRDEEREKAEARSPVEPSKSPLNRPSVALNDCAGRIIMLSSRAAFRVNPGVALYGASKAGDHSLAQTLARTLASDKIAFFAVAPTVVATDMTSRWLGNDLTHQAFLQQLPMGRFPYPEEVGSVLAWLAVEAPLSASGTIVDINGASHVHH
jgi:3-oxoacyl-[acyl-carrier protein] reductase